MKDDKSARHRCERLRSEQYKWRNQLDEMAAQHSGPVRDFRQVMKIPAQRIGQRLCFVVIKKTRQVTPALVVPQLDQSGAKFSAEQHPTQYQHGNDRGLNS